MAQQNSTKMHLKNLVNFFTDFEIPQIVIMHVGQKKFICNSIILALHSDQFESVISSGSQEIILDGFDYKGGCKAVRKSLMFMYGDKTSVENIDIETIIGVCRFAVVWQIPLLWDACMVEITAHLLKDPSEIFSFYTILQITSNEAHQHKLEKIFQYIIRTHCISLINSLLQPHDDGGHMDLNNVDRGLLVTLLRDHCKSPSCGELAIKLLSLSDHSKNIVLEALDKIEVSTAFASEARFIYFLEQLCPFIDRQGKTDLYRSKLLALQEKYFLKSNKGDATASVNPHTDPVAQVLTAKNLVAGNGESSAVDEGNVSLDHAKSNKSPKDRLLTYWNTRSVKLLCAGITKYPLYSQLEIVLYYIQMRIGSKLSIENFKKLISPFIGSRLISATLINDLVQMLPKYCLLGKDKWFNSIRYIAQSETFHNSCHFKGPTNIQRLANGLLDHGRIQFDRNQNYFCEIKSSGPASHTLKLGRQLDIMFNEDECGLRFSCGDGKGHIHQKYIIHCYMLGLDKDNKIVSYISLYQWTKSEIAEFAKGCYGVTIKVIYAKNVELKTMIMIPRAHGQKL